jgi:hypothetical protein
MPVKMELVDQAAILQPQLGRLQLPGDASDFALDFVC